jgi:uncharacterized protein YgiM (DUF1202 family)
MKVERQFEEVQMARIKFSKKTEPIVKTTTNTTEITGGIVTNTATNIDTVSLGGTIVFEEETKAPAPKEEKFERPKFFDKELARTYTTTSKVNLRAGAGLNKPVITIISNQKEVKCEGYYTDDWLLIEFAGYKGYTMRKFLK